jgi:hypothetical protein
MTKISDNDAALGALSPARVEAHLRFLSHPLLEGRAAGSRGGRLAEEYIRSVFAAAGIGPAPGHGYFQKVPFVGMDPTPELRFTAGDAEWAPPRFKDDYVLKAGVPEEHVVAESELVFVGYGITAPEFGWDGYADADVRGKILLVRVNDPGTPDRPDFFGGRALTYYGRWTYKLEEAARRGAAGVLLIHTDESAGYGWNVVRSSNTGPQYDLAKSDDPKLQVKGWVTERVARALLGSARDSAVGGVAAPLNDAANVQRDHGMAAKADALLAASARPDFKPIPLGITVRASVKSTIQHVEGSNVVGVIPGSDPQRSDEAIVMMSHHDHLGLKTSDAGETLVYAGAHDNASGVALMLAIAAIAMRGRSSSSRRLPRSRGCSAPSGTCATRSSRSRRRSRYSTSTARTCTASRTTSRRSVSIAPIWAIS